VTWEKSYNIEHNGVMFMYCEQCKAAACLKVLCQGMHVGTKENHRESHWELQ
jgi:hypothetical protein